MGTVLRFAKPISKVKSDLYRDGVHVELNRETDGVLIRKTERGRTVAVPLTKDEALRILHSLELLNEEIWR